MKHIHGSDHVLQDKFSLMLNNDTSMTYNRENGIFAFPESMEQDVSTKNFRSMYKNNTLLNREYQPWCTAFFREPNSNEILKTICVLENDVTLSNNKIPTELLARKNLSDITTSLWCLVISSKVEMKLNEMKCIVLLLPVYN